MTAAEIHEPQAPAVDQTAALTAARRQMALCTAEEEAREDITEAEATLRMPMFANPSLHGDERDEAYAWLLDAVKWLAELRSPMFDLLSVEPENRDQELLEHQADADVEEALNALVGRTT